MANCLKAISVRVQALSNMVEIRSGTTLHHFGGVILCGGGGWGWGCKGEVDKYSGLSL